MHKVMLTLDDIVGRMQAKVTTTDELVAWSDVLLSWAQTANDEIMMLRASVEKKEADNAILLKRLDEPREKAFTSSDWESLTDHRSRLSSIAERLYIYRIRNDLVATAHVPSALASYAEASILAARAFLAQERAMFHDERARRSPPETGEGGGG